MRSLRYTLTLAFVLTIAALAAAQSTSVTLQVTDTPDGQTWNNGTWSVQLMPQSGPTPSNYFLAGTLTPVPNQTQSGTLSATGGAAITMTPNASIAPALSIWAFTVCPQATAGCFFQQVPIAGATQTVTLTPASIRITLTGIPYRVLAYADTEVNNSPLGALYYNLTSSTYRFCTSTTCSGAGWSNISGGGGGPTINPTNNVLPVRSNATTFIDTPLIFSNGSSTAARGIAFNDPTISQGGTPGTTFYIYCVVASDVFTNTRSTCFDTALGASTLNATNFNTITIGAYSSTSPYLAPVGSCDVRRTFSGGTPSSLGKIGTIPSCAGGGSFNDQGAAGDSTATPLDTSGVLASTGPAQIGQSYIYSDEVNLYVLGGIPVGGSPISTVTPGYTHDVIVGGGGPSAYANSGITAVGWNGSGTAHACTSIGYGNTCNGDSAFVAGINAGSTGAAIVIGSNAGGSGGGSIVIGGNGSSTAGSTVSVGQGASDGGFTNCIAIGLNATCTATNQAVINAAANTLNFFAGSVASPINIHGSAFLSESTAGNKFTTNGGCTEGTLVGGGSAGKFTVGQNTACTVVITMGALSGPSKNGWSCWYSDQTAIPAVAIRQTGSNTTTASLLMTVATNDVVTFGCIGY